MFVLYICTEINTRRLMSAMSVKDLFFISGKIARGFRSDYARVLRIMSVGTLN